MLKKNDMHFLSIFPFLSFVILAGMLTGRILLLQKRGIKVSSVNGKNPRYLYFLYPLFALLFILWFYELMRIAFHFPEIPGGISQKLFSFEILQFAGILLIVTALILFFITLNHFNDSLRFGMDDRNQGNLITSGIFLFSRNPFFLSIVLYFIGLAMLHSSLFFIVMAFLAILNIHFFILKEEKFLRKYYGEDYTQYTRKVRRYL
jgi:protein-S-isoprenylcysteine O-methyltransferase Ste14